MKEIPRTQYKYCLHCGKLITSKRHKYCSDKCSWRYASKKKREQLDKKLAEEFKEEFSTL